MARGRGGFIGQDGLNAPDSPTGVSGTGGNTTVSVAFTAPTDVGGSAITGFRAQSNTGVGVSGSSSPITVTGLSNGTSYTFNVWAINAFGYSAPSDASGSVTPELGDRGLIAGGASTNIISYITISTSGSDADFGDLSTTTSSTSGLSSSTRAVFRMGQLATTTGNPIEYVTIASEGNSTDFGDFTVMSGRDSAATSNGTRGLFMGQIGTTTGISAAQDTIAYITIASAGNASDFGDLARGANDTINGRNAALASTTRAIVAGGGGSSNPATNIMDYVTIGTTGNATDFGDLTLAMNRNVGVSSNTRGVFAAGLHAGDYNNTINYVTIASTGNATDFGDVTVSKYSSANGNLSNKTYGIFAGGDAQSAGDNTTDISYITIASTGNSSDFGDLGTGRGYAGAASNSHGGLS